jgi:hypothetical protein
VHDGHDGPIAKAWNVDTWPTLYFVDAKGIIVCRKPSIRVLQGCIKNGAKGS